MLKILQRIIQEVNAAPNMEQALLLVVQRVCEALEADSSSVFICDDAQGEYLLMATVGLNETQVGKVRLNYGEGLIGLVGEREEPINIDDGPSHPNFHFNAKIKEEEYKGFLGVPIIEQGELLGVLVVQQKEKRFFSEDEEAFCLTLAVQLASGIGRAKAKGSLEALGKKRKRKQIKAETVFS